MKPARKTQTRRAPAKLASNRARSRRVTPLSFAGWSADGNIIRLNRMPLAIPPDAAVGYLEIGLSSRLIFIGSVDNIKKLPKSFPFEAQAELPGCEQKSGQLCLVAPNGKIYLVVDSEPYGC